MARSSPRLEVHGYREFLRATNRAEKSSKSFVRDNLRQVGDIVKNPAADDLRSLQPSGKSAAGLRTRVRVRGIAVEQSLRKTTGKHPEWGAIQMRKILIPNLESHEREIEAAFERAIDRIADHFDD